jgi:hypothetical protein
VCELLNEALALDPEAMQLLMEGRVACNQDLAKHATIQVASTDNGYRVGLLGILNGIFGISDKGWGPIAALCEEETLKIIRFEPTDPKYL